MIPVLLRRKGGRASGNTSESAAVSTISRVSSMAGVFFATLPLHEGGFTLQIDEGGMASGFGC
jgi:hypothetical protein